jgi:hypothetical protein
MLVTFEILEEEGELVAVHDGAFGLLVAVGYDWDMLRDTVNESVAQAIADAADVEIEFVIDNYRRSRFKHHYDEAVADRIRRRLSP